MYCDEVNATARAGAEHIDLRMSANNKPNGDLIANLIRLLGGAPPSRFSSIAEGALTVPDWRRYMNWRSTVGRQA